jgi:arylsulfatase A-like enzyme
MDIFATITALTNQKMPSATVAAEDSYNVLPALLGQTYEKPLRPIVLNQSGHGAWTLREGPWKFIEAYDPATEPGAKKSTMPKTAFQLYNLARDPKETDHLYTTEPEIARRLQALLNQVRESGHSR